MFHNKNSFLRSSLATAALLTLAAAAQAQASSYLLVGGGRSDFSLDCSGTSACDKSGSALQLVGGYRMASGWALEGLYVNFGKSTAVSFGINAEVKATALGGGAAFIVETSPNWTFTGRLGLANVKLKGRASLGSVSSGASESSTNLYTGLALSYNFSKTFGTELGYLRTRGELEGDKGDLSAITLSARFTF